MVSEIALGNWLTQGRILDQSQTTQLVQHAFDLGIIFFDTADVYADGAAETALGAALQSGIRRQDVVLASKCYFPMSERPNDRGLGRKHIFESVHASLGRLQTDYLDIYQCHRFDEDTPLEETVMAMGDLVRQGKILYWGVSEWTADQIELACEIAHLNTVSAPISNQPRYSIFERGIEAEVIPASRRCGIGQVVFSPLAQGILTGKYKPGEPFPPGTRAADENAGQFIRRMISDERLEIVQKLAGLAQELDLTMSQLALAWVLRQANVASAIIGASRTEQLDENAAASGRTLPPETWTTIDQLTGAAA